MTDFYATLVIAAKFFKNRTHFNNSKFHINPTRPPCFLNEYVMLMSPTIQYNSFHRVHFLRMLSKSLINMTGFYATLDIAAKFFKNRTHFNNSRFLIMCYKNTENAPNIYFNRIPRQTTHSHIILKLQGPNYYYDSMNINVAMKTTISNNRNGAAMIFERICDGAITSYPLNIFSMGTLFTKVIKIIDQHDRLLRYPRPCSKVFQESNGDFIRLHQWCFLHRKWPASCHVFVKYP